MQEKLEKYLKDTGLKITPSKVEDKFLNELSSVLKTEPNANVENILTYKVPKLSPDGSCSITEELDDRAYNLKETFENNGFKDEDIYSLVGRLDKIIEFLHKEIGADWSGIYKKLNTKSGPALVKLAYRGNPSRAEFPLTKEFAEHSNNSTVGLTGKAVLVNSVSEHIEGGKPYYVCDDKVKSELCLPIFEDKSVIGIIDVESFKEKFFDDEKVSKIALVCAALSKIL